MRVALALTFLGLACCSSSASTGSSGLLTLAHGPGADLADHALVGTRFPVTVSPFSLPGGDCGIGLCPPPSETLTLVSAECDGSACEVAHGTFQGQPAFLVTPTAPGPTVLHVHVRDDAGNELEDTLDLTFVASAHVEVHADASQIIPLVDRAKYASLPGNELTWQVTLEADDGTRLAADTGLVTVTVEGNAYAKGSAPESNDPSDFTLRAAQPGTSTVHLAVGTSVRDVGITVIAPEEVVAAELRSSPALTSSGAFDAKLEGPDPFSATAVSSLKVPLTADQSMWAVVLHTKSGVLAMGGASLLAVSPSRGVAAVTNAPADGIDDGILVVTTDTSSPTNGLLTGVIGGAKVSLPVDVVE